MLNTGRFLYTILQPIHCPQLKIQSLNTYLLYHYHALPVIKTLKVELGLFCPYYTATHKLYSIQTPKVENGSFCLYYTTTYTLPLTNSNLNKD